MTALDALARLSAALDEDERIARAAAETSGGGFAWHVTTHDYDGIQILPTLGPVGDAENDEEITAVTNGAQRTNDATRHIEHFDPARVLRQAEAVRAVLADRESLHSRTRLSDPAMRAYDDGMRAAYDRVAEILAGIYTEPEEKS